MKIPTPVTFDQPLWYKAMGIKAEQHLQIVIRLGGFHTMISFMGCTGMLMRGSGLADLLEEVYSEVTVKDMMAGKAVSRAIREHLLTEGDLISLLLESLIEGGKIDISAFEPFSKKPLDGVLTEKDFISFTETQEFRSVDQILKDTLDTMREKCRTAKLWCEYQH